MNNSADLVLENGFVLRHLRNEEDAAQFIGLSQEVTGEGPICDRLIHQRPASKLGDYCVVEDPASDRIVSTTCLLPWKISLDGVALEAAMLEMVVTHPDYRRHGLVRTQIRQFQQRVVQQGADLSIIQGIPFYYRQFGYAYALDHTHTITLSTRLIPDGVDVGALRLRLPAVEDFPRLADLYRAAMSRQQVHVLRSVADWQYLAGPAGMAVQLLEDEHTHQVLGYCCSQVQNGLLTVRESGVLNLENAQALLALLKRDFTGEVNIVGNSADFLFRLAELLGGSVQTAGQWLINLPEPDRFLSRLVPLFEKRLELAGYRHLSMDLTVNFFRNAFLLKIVDNHVVNVTNAGFVDTSMGASGGDLWIPPDAFVRLAFGYRSLDELSDAWPDIWVRPQSRPVLEALFPKLSSLILMPY